MHFIRNVKYAEEYKLFLTFEDGTVRLVDLKDHLYGEIFDLLRLGGAFWKALAGKKEKTMKIDLKSIL